VAISTSSGVVSMNVTLAVNSTLFASGLQYNNITDTFYAIGFNTALQNYDVAVINHLTGDLKYLGVFNSTFGGDVTGMGLDKTNNILSMVYANGTNLILANIDLHANQLINSIPISSKSVSSNLAFANL